MEFFFEKLKGYRSLVLTWLTTFGLWLDGVKASLADVVNVVTDLPMSLDGAEIGAFVAALTVTVKVVWDRFRGVKDEAV